MGNGNFGDVVFEAWEAFKALRETEKLDNVAVAMKNQNIDDQYMKEQQRQIENQMRTEEFESKCKNDIDSWECAN